MQTAILGQADIRQLLPMQECIEIMAEALGSLACGGAALPLRSSIPIPGDRQNAAAGFLLTMPCYLDDPAVIALKLLTVFPNNSGTAFEAHQGSVLLFDRLHGSLMAILDATEITAIRTAAVSAVATRLLAKSDAGDLALIGSGVQAHTHLESMCLARPLRSVRVWSRNPQHARVFAEREDTARQFQVTSVATAEAAVRDADIICTVTSASTPVLQGAWIARGAHINAIGAFSPGSRELDTAAVLQSRLFVDRRESALSEAGDFLIPRAEGVIADDHIVAEIGEIVIGKSSGRRSTEEITLFKSLGLAIEDAAAADYVYRQAIERGIGTRVDFSA